MTIPAQLKIGAHQYQVFEEDHLGEWDGFRGKHWQEKLAIRLNRNTMQSLKEQCFLHEVLHACWCNAEMDNIDGIKDHEELIVAMLSTQLYQVLKDNKLDFSNGQENQDQSS